jgi:hypothetical protein
LGGPWFETSLDENLETPISINKPGIVTHICNSRYLGGMYKNGSEQKVRIYMKNNFKKGWRLLFKDKVSASCSFRDFSPWWAGSMALGLKQG